MYSVVVNGYKAIEIPVDLYVAFTDIIYNENKTEKEQHEKLCLLLRINRFVPTPGHKLYSIRAITIEVYDDSRIIMNLGSWFECYFCHKDITTKPLGTTCPGCGQSSLKNFKWESPPKKELKKIISGQI